MAYDQILAVAETTAAIAQRLPPEFWTTPSEDATEPAWYVARAAIEMEKLATVDGTDNLPWGVTHSWDDATRDAAQAARLGFMRSAIKKKRSARATKKR